jgi:hypothetical protein
LVKFMDGTMQSHVTEGIIADFLWKRMNRNVLICKEDRNAL